ncbi:hypothetical protein HYFRA_00003599 [Hymenoscyphus fraxineus]|uniref:Uncharacterized protein n=1 Tax=Hymenoscyphus fraxineus TaxID=746836 RepID=A0A9N9KYL1_9HELO|nr:hypothetical protein HYFRA_00003599 [Hymenoscyphus fraxineus]
MQFLYTFIAIASLATTISAEGVRPCLQLMLNENGENGKDGGWNCDNGLLERGKNCDRYMWSETTPNWVCTWP